MSCEFHHHRSERIVCWLLAAGCRLLVAGCWLLAAGCRLQAGCWLLGGYWLLAAGCWLLASGCWLLAAGCWRRAGLIGTVLQACMSTSAFITDVYIYGHRGDYHHRGAPAPTSLAHYGSDGEGYEGSQEGHAQGVLDHIHGLVQNCSGPLLDCLIDSAWRSFLLGWVGWVLGASGRPREVAETPSDGLGVPSGVPRSPRGPGQKY